MVGPFSIFSGRKIIFACLLVTEAICDHICECLSPGYSWKSDELARSKRIWLTVRDDSTLDKATVERCDSYARSRLERMKLKMLYR